MSGHEHEPVVEGVAAFAADVPHDVLERLCSALEQHAAGAPLWQWLKGLAELPQPELREKAADLIERFARAAPSAGPAGLAWALRCAEAASRAERARRTLELVWTGPTPAGSSLRRTEQALLEVIARARKRLLIVSFAAYDIPRVRQALLAAEARGVGLAFVLESKEQSGGKVTFDGAAALGDIAGRATVYVWPLERRPKDAFGRSGALHAKCAVADEDVLFVSSANLTGYALTLNMELGVLVTGGEVPAHVARHFRALITEGILEPLVLPG